MFLLIRHYSLLFCFEICGIAVFSGVFVVKLKIKFIFNY